MPEDQRLHVPVQFLAVTLVIFAIHRESKTLRRDVAGNVSLAAEVSYPITVGMAY